MIPAADPAERRCQKPKHGDGLRQVDRLELIDLLRRLDHAQEAERSAIARLVARKVQDLGQTWDGLIIPAGLRSAPPRGPGDLAFCVRHLDGLTPWERAFVGEIAEATGELSERQLAKLAEIAGRLRRRPRRR